MGKHIVMSVDGDKVLFEYEGASVSIQRHCPTTDRITIRLSIKSDDKSPRTIHCKTKDGVSTAFNVSKEAAFCLYEGLRVLLADHKE